MLRTVTGMTVALAIALSASGCGGGQSATQTTAAQQRAVAVYHAGLQRWATQMIRALNGMSVLFSTPKAVRQLEAGEHAVGVKLAGYERTLARCTVVLKSLGAAPSRFVVIRRHALHACANLERGAALVKRGVEEFQGGRGVAGFDTAAAPLNDGQLDIGLVRSELKPLAPG
jgi:hypothetical protein